MTYNQSIFTALLLASILSLACLTDSGSGVQLASFQEQPTGLRIRGHARGRGSARARCSPHGARILVRVPQLAGEAFTHGMDHDLDHRSPLNDLDLSGHMHS